MKKSKREEEQKPNQSKTKIQTTEEAQAKVTTQANKKENVKSKNEGREVHKIRRKEEDGKKQT